MNFSADKSGTTLTHACLQGATIVGGAAFEARDLSHAQSLAPHVVAVDGGANTLVDLGVMPEAVIGDMDSIRWTPPEDVHLLRITEQETTDFEKCLSHVNAPLYIGVGFLGGRLDHTLAVLHGLIRHRSRPVILIGEADIVFAAPLAWSMEMAAGDRVSYYPIMPSMGISSEGLRWPINGLTFAAGAQIGTSNEATGGRVSAAFNQPGIVTMVPKTYLQAVTESLHGTY